MSWDTSKAIVARFYGFQPSEIDAMTLKKFTTWLKEVAIVQKMEFGEGKEETSLDGDAGFAMAKQLFPRGRSRRR